MIYGLNINEKGTNQPSGLFSRIHGGEVRDLVFWQPRIYSSGDNNKMSVLGGEMRDGNATVFFWLGGGIKDVGSYTGSSISDYPSQGMPGRAFNSKVTVLAQDVNQIGESYRGYRPRHGRSIEH